MTTAADCEGMAARVCATNGAAEIEDVARPTRLLRTNVLAREWLLRRSPTDARTDAPLTAVGLAASASVTLAVQCVDTGQLAMQVNLLLAPHSSINGATFGYALVDFVVARFICEPINSVDRLNARFLLDEASGELLVLSWNQGGTLSLLWFTTPTATREVFPAEGPRLATNAGGERERPSSLVTDFLLRELVIFEDPGPGLRVPSKVRNRIAFRPPSPCPPCVRCMKRCGGLCGEPPLRDRPPKPRAPSTRASPQGTPTPADREPASAPIAAAAPTTASLVAVADTGPSASREPPYAVELSAAAKAAVALNGGEEVPPDTCSSVSTGPDPTALYTDLWDVPEPVDTDPDVRLAVEWDRAANSRMDNMELVLSDSAWSSASDVSSGSPPPAPVSPLYDSYESGLVAQLQRSVLDAKTGGVKRPGGGVLTSPTNFLGFAAAVALFQSSSHALMCGLWACPKQGPTRMVARSVVGVYAPSADDQQSLRIRASEALAPKLESPSPSLAAPPPGSSDFVRAVPLLARLLRQQHRVGTVDAAVLSDEERAALAAVSGGADLSTAVATLEGLLSVEGAPLLLASALADDDHGVRSRGGSGSGGSGGAQSGAGGAATASVRGAGGAAHSGSGGGGDSGGVDQADGLGDDGTGKKRRRTRKNLEELAHNTILYNRAIRNRESARRSNERRKLRRQAARSEAAAAAASPPPTSAANANGTEPTDGAAASPPPPSGSLSVASLPSSSTGGDAGADDRGSISAAATAAAALAAVTVPAAPLPVDGGVAEVTDEEMLLLESGLLSELPSASFSMEKPLPWPEDTLSGPLYPGV